jgi:two-component system sensor histidine kinase QseC
LRNRFFFIILATLIFSAVGIHFVHVNFFKSQRLKRIDRQIAEASTSLVESPQFRQAVKGHEPIDGVISKVLMGGRIGKVFMLRNEEKKILFQSFNAGLLKAEIPTRPEWVTVETENEYVRVRNLPLPGVRHRTLQVGLVVDRNFLYWEIIDSPVVFYVAGIVAAMFCASVILTIILLSPLRLLTGHLNDATSGLGHLKGLQPLPNRLARHGRGFWAKSDEFSNLLHTIQKLIDRINLNYRLTRTWTSQIAHELKTPLAIVRAETEGKKKAGLIPVRYANDIVGEIQRMSETISQFLDWAELENSQLQRDLHALRMRSVVKVTGERLDKISPGRIRLQLDSDFPVFANPIHVDQLISNLVTNALKFSPEAAAVDLILRDRRLIVRDSGSGLPGEVKERLGEPFNVGANSRGKTGNGLGLAWVSTVAKLYQWNFEVRSDSSGTEAAVQFPVEI